MRIRNDHPVDRLLPTQHTFALAGEELDWPDDAPVPDGFTVTVPPPAPPAEPTVKELRAQAVALGLKVPSKAKKDEIAALIAAATEPAGDETTHPDGDESAAADQE